MSQLMDALRVRHRGPVVDPHGVLSPAEIAHAQHAEYVDPTWPYVALSTPRAFVVREDDGQRVWAPVWYRHHGGATLVLAYDRASRMARGITQALEAYADTLRARYPDLFPSHLRHGPDALVPQLNGEWAFLVVYGVHDLLARQLPRLDALPRAALLLQALTYADRLARDGVGIAWWELGVLLARDEEALPRLKLLRVDGITFHEGETERLRRQAVRTLVAHTPWGFERDTDAGAQHAARLLDWARTHPDDLTADGLAYLKRELRDGFATHPRAAQLAEWA